MQPEVTKNEKIRKKYNQKRTNVEREIINWIQVNNGPDVKIYCFLNILDI